jgi:hypothetical protein
MSSSVRSGSSHPVAGTRAARRPTLALAPLALAALALAARADAFVYWTSSNSIGRANLDSNGNVLSVDPNFIKGVDLPPGLAVDGEHTYWSDGYSTIWQANIDGSGAPRSLITGADVPSGVAVNGADVYWANQVSPGTIGHADIDSSGNVSNINQSFITGADVPVGVAADSAHVYWANQGTIGRANLDGSGANHSFISLPAGSNPTAVAVDALTAACGGQGRRSSARTAPTI